MNIKPLGEAQDIQANPSTGTLTSGTLAWVVNAHTSVNKVTIAGTVASSVIIAPNTGIIIEKEAGAVLDVTTSGGEVWATAIAYTN